MATEAIIYQQIVDMNWDQAIYTASPNNTINVAQFAAKGSGTNIAVALTPKGTGYISAQVPDGTAAGGNARGTKCVDLQLTRGAAAQVAAGESNWTLGESNRCAPTTYSNWLLGASNIAGNGYWITLLGYGNHAEAPICSMIGTSNYSAASRALLLGTSNSVSNGTRSVLIGESNTCNSIGGYCYVFGIFGHGYLDLSHVRSTTRFAANGDCQKQMLFGRKVTTNDTPSEIFWPTNRLVIPAGRLWAGKLTISAGKSDGSKVAIYERNVSLKRVGNATSLVALETVGTDVTDGTAITVTADDTNEALSVFVTGVAGETWRWMAVFEFNDLLFGA